LQPNTGQGSLLHLARGYKQYTAGHFRRWKQLWDCSQLHPCRVAGISEGAGGGWSNYTIGQQSSSNRCVSSRCTVHSSFAQPIAPKQTRYAAVGASRACAYAAPDQYLVAQCVPPDDPTRSLSPCCPSPASTHPCTLRAAATVRNRTFPAAEAALGLQPGAPLPCRWDHSPVQVQEEREVITRPGSRAAATDTLRRAAPCAVASPGRFTSKTYALCSGRRLARLHVCCARLTAASTHAALCAPAFASTWARVCTARRLPSTPGAPSTLPTPTSHAPRFLRHLPIDVASQASVVFNSVLPAPPHL
jgi:hypothetical protein